MIDDRTPERKRLDAWSAENPRDERALVALAAWLNTTPDKLPKEMRVHTCAATKEAWARVADALAALQAEALIDLLCLADETIMELNGCFPLGHTESEMQLRGACLAIRSVTGGDHKERKRRAVIARQRGGA